MRIPVLSSIKSWWHEWNWRAWIWFELQVALPQEELELFPANPKAWLLDAPFFWTSADATTWVVHEDLKCWIQGFAKRLRYPPAAFFSWRSALLKLTFCQHPPRRTLNWKMKNKTHSKLVNKNIHKKSHPLHKTLTFVTARWERWLVKCLIHCTYTLSFDLFTHTI